MLCTFLSHIGNSVGPGPNAVHSDVSQLSLPKQCYRVKGLLQAAFVLQPWVKDSACRAPPKLPMQEMVIKQTFMVMILDHITWL